MKLTRILLRLYTSALRGASGFFARRLKNNFYLLLAGMFTLFILADVFFLHAVVDVRQTAYDLVIKNRIIKPKPDNEIVIVDVNEASLSAMAKDYGRWPWPRQVFAEFVENVEQQEPKAIIFDILFSDPDVFNVVSDVAFNDTIAATSNTFFPMLRLPEANDRLSELRPKMIPGIKPVDGEQQGDSPIAMILPKSLTLSGQREKTVATWLAHYRIMVRQFRFTKNSWPLIQRTARTAAVSPSLSRISDGLYSKITTRMAQ